MDTFTSERKNITVIAFDKSTSKKLHPTIRTENMIYFHPLTLFMKYRFGKFVVKFLC